MTISPTPAELKELEGVRSRLGGVFQSYAIIYRAQRPDPFGLLLAVEKLIVDCLTGVRPVPDAMTTSESEELIEALKAQVKIMQEEIDPLRTRNKELLSRNSELDATIGVLEAELKACKVLSGN